MRDPLPAGASRLSRLSTLRRSRSRCFRDRIRFVFVYFRSEYKLSCCKEELIRLPGFSLPETETFGLKFCPCYCYFIVIVVIVIGGLKSRGLTKTYVMCTEKISPVEIPNISPDYQCSEMTCNP
jgi:hypothetical protein